MMSILETIKKLLGIESSYNHFDTDIIVAINTVFFSLNQIGIGPPNGFSITDSSTEWTDYLPVDDDNYEAVKTYMQLKVRLLFDPPTSSFVLDAMERQIKEIEWRLKTQAELDISDVSDSSGCRIYFDVVED